ncbi:hypothetical protein K491DRAFT_281639 [Lophiostoma macrostomum CBS 122681]|uniref:SnoaL-like domain-containing protein n=1 Tax=Lophiostoma macrostomum CBS 122681 TaxID=1314788 RepID=A0A6A6TS39_9PLEO|nr:hypothetical protein K491DRAFT_281639 [Lophiostoma macrostomum CBS 122681]
MRLPPQVSSLLLLTCLIPFTQAVASANSVARNLQNIESVRTIKDIQRQISQLAAFGLYANISLLFAPNGTFQVLAPTNSSSTPYTISTTITGRAAIAAFLIQDAGLMNGIAPGSMDIWITETPLVNLEVDSQGLGQRAKGRWNGIRFQGDGKGGTRLRGGIYENEYVYLGKEGWKVDVLRYYGMYEGEGEYKDGWRNVGGNGLGRVKYHMTPDGAGVPVPGFYEGIEEIVDGDMDVDIEELEKRVQRLNDEDEVRNLMHSHGYYVDRRMWTDVVDLHSSNTSVTVRGEGGGNFTGPAGVRKVLERMGPENLTQGINNDHPILDMIVEVDPNGREAVARGIEIGMIGDANNKTARWEFNVFRNGFVKGQGVWKVKHVDITPLIVADYHEGWGYGGLKTPNMYTPPFLNTSRPRSTSPSTSTRRAAKKDPNLDNLQRRLAKALAFDAAENLSTAYGYFLDDLDCSLMGSLFASLGHKASPFAGFYSTPTRITDACFASWGHTNTSSLRSGISYHWRPQPVILVSSDGRSATLRARLLQPNTALDKPGAFNSAMYHDQMVLENGIWRLWSVTIDEFYWTSSSWAGGWSNATLRNDSTPDPEPAGWTKKYPPDLSIKDVGDREAGFRGGSGRYVEWPMIQRMWFQYRNLVSGRTPEWFWEGCVPCRVRRDWALEENGYQEPPSGPVVGDGTRR